MIKHILFIFCDTFRIKGHLINTRGMDFNVSLRLYNTFFPENEILTQM